MSVPTSTAPVAPAPATSGAASDSGQPGSGLFVAGLASEWTKLRSVRSTVWSLFATFAIMVGLGSLLSLAYVSRYERIGLVERLTFDPTAHSLRGLFLAQLAIGVLGVLTITAEHATELIRTTFIAVPQRRVVLAAKGAVFGLVALLVCMVAAFAAFFSGQAILDTKHLGVALSDPHVLRAVLGAGAYLTIVGLISLAVGAIVRRTAGAIATTFALVLVLPLLSQALPSPWDRDVGKFLPSELGAALFSVRARDLLLSPGIALLVAVGWVAALLAVATLLITRRDA